MTLFSVMNQGLFSNNYIEKHLPNSPAWTQFDAKLEATFALLDFPSSCAYNP